MINTAVDFSYSVREHSSTQSTKVCEAVKPRLANFTHTADDFCLTLRDLSTARYYYF